MKYLVALARPYLSRRVARVILLRSLLFQVLFYAVTAALGILGLPLLLLPRQWMMRFGTRVVGADAAAAANGPAALDLRGARARASAARAGDHRDEAPIGLGHARRAGDLRRSPAIVLKRELRLGAVLRLVSP